MRKSPSRVDCACLCGITQNVLATETFSYSQLLSDELRVYIIGLRSIYGISVESVTMDCSDIKPGGGWNTRTELQVTTSYASPKQPLLFDSQFN